MSRVGKYPVEVPSGVTVTVSDRDVTAKGKQGELSYTVPDEIDLVFEDNKLAVNPRRDDKRSRQLWGTARARLNNLVKGVGEGFKRNLDMTGVGYKAQIRGSTLVLSLGYSHDIEFPIPQDLKINCPSPTSIEIAGADKQRVGQAAAVIRGYRPPEPYKGKGVRYSDETILRKEGKKK